MRAIYPCLISLTKIQGEHSPFDYRLVVQYKNRRDNIYWEGEINLLKEDLLAIVDEITRTVEEDKEETENRIRKYIAKHPEVLRPDVRG